MIHFHSLINIINKSIAVETIQSNNGNRINNKRLIFLIFSFFFLVNIISAGGHFDWWDGVETFFVTESMVLKHSAKLQPDVPKRKRTKF
jgi:abortive infection bacteriophage resistance protein